MTNRQPHFAEGVLRITLAPIFLIAGLGHFGRATEMIDKLMQAPMGPTLASVLPLEVLVRAAGVPLVVGGAFLLVGFKTRFAAVLLAAILVPITLATHVGAIASIGPFLKNIALLGGLFFFYDRGARALAPGASPR